MAVVGAAFFAHLFYHLLTYGSWQRQETLSYAPAALTIATLVLLASLGFHNFVAIRTQNRPAFLWKGIGAVAFAFSIFLTILFFTQIAERYSRGTLIFQIAAISITVVSTRALFYSWLHAAIASRQIEARRVALIGDETHRFIYADRLKDSGIHTVCFHELPKYHDLKHAAPKPLIRNMIDEIRSLRPDDIIILAKHEITPAMLKLTSSLAELPAGVHIVPVDALSVLAAAQISQFGNLKTIQLYWPPLSTFDLLIKRTVDLVLATIGLIVLSPLFVVVAIAIKLDSAGPVFFRQRRHGFNNNEIYIFKFRSMISIENDASFIQTAEDDARVTRLGRIIRRTNIDELPQLFNVLRGEMSIVGPRPHATAHNLLFENMITPFSRRHNVKPGITGWAQVNGHRGPTDTLEKMQRRIEYDLQYVDNWSFLFDMKIIVLTLCSKRAYTNAF